MRPIAASSAFGTTGLVWEHAQKPITYCSVPYALRYGADYLLLVVPFCTITGNVAAILLSSPFPAPSTPPSHCVTAYAFFPICSEPLYLLHSTCAHRYYFYCERISTSNCERHSTCARRCFFYCALLGASSILRAATHILPQAIAIITQPACVDASSTANHCDRYCTCAPRRIFYCERYISHFLRVRRRGRSERGGRRIRGFHVNFPCTHLEAGTEQGIEDIPVDLKPSKIHGRGLFAKRIIKAGDIVV